MCPGKAVDCQGKAVKWPRKRQRPVQGKGRRRQRKVKGNGSGRSRKGQGQWPFFLTGAGATYFQLLPEMKSGTSRWGAGAASGASSSGSCSAGGEKGSERTSERSGKANGQ